MTANGLIPPHGGKLVNLVVDQSRATELARQARDLTQIRLAEREQCDLELMAVGAMSPLTGFMGQADFDRVCEEMKLSDGQVWPVPITCAVEAAVGERIDIGQPVTLTDDQRRPLAILTVTEKYPHNKKQETEKVFRTTDEAHPGVAVTMAQGDVCLAGTLEVIMPRHEPQFPERRLTPAQTRAAFQERGWRTVVAFQTRNPIHRAHEHITKCALEICDGLLIHPLVGQTQKGDIPADVRMKCYEVLLANYYNPRNTFLSVLPAAMRYAGPREAVLHALVRKNYGCTHFIVGRDHAGVGNYYGTYDAQRIFDELEPGAMASDKTTSSGKDDRVFLSGTAVREMLSRGERPPAEFTRPEIADILIEAMRGQR
jgi:sulfate adenylyltransferase